MTELEQIIVLNEKLIYKLSSKFPNVPKEDLYQAGVIGLIKAYNNYDKNSNTKFTTYAYNYIFGEMYELNNSSNTIKLNKDILKIYKKIEQARFLLTQKNSKEPTIKEISSFLNIEETIIQDIYNATRTIMSTDEDNKIIDSISSKNNNIDSKIDLNDSINNLSEEERKIIILRYYKDLTQQEIANYLGLSQVKVSRYEQKSLTKMYKYLSS